MTNRQRQLVIWGTGGHARVIADIVLRAEQYDLYGFIDDVYPERHGQRLFGKPILGGREVLSWLPSASVTHVLVGIGDNAARLHLADELTALGFALGSAVHPGAIIAHEVRIESGTAIMGGVVINPFAQIGPNVIVNTAASIDHDCNIAAGAHIGPGAHLGGVVTVEGGAWIGIGAVVRDRITIGAGAVIGAGAAVVTDIPAGMVAYGVPARVVRKAG